MARRDARMIYLEIGTFSIRQSLQWKILGSFLMFRWTPSGFFPAIETSVFLFTNKSWILPLIFPSKAPFFFWWFPPWLSSGFRTVSHGRVFQRQGPLLLRERLAECPRFQADHARSGHWDGDEPIISVFFLYGKYRILRDFNGSSIGAQWDFDGISMGFYGRSYWDCMVSILLGFSMTKHPLWGTAMLP